MNRKEFLDLAVKGTAAAAVLSVLPSTLTAYADEGEKLYIPGTYSAEAPGKEKVIVTMTFDETKITDTMTAMVYCTIWRFSGQMTFFISILVSLKNLVHEALASCAFAACVLRFALAMLTPQFQSLKIIWFLYAECVCGTICSTSSFRYVRSYSSCSCLYDNCGACILCMQE